MKKLIATIALVLVAGACAVPPPASDPVWSEVCVPASSTFSSIRITPIYVPESAWIDWNYHWLYTGMLADEGVAEGTATGLVAGEPVSLGPIDPGLCLHIKPSPGLTYAIAQIPTVKINYPYINGWEPGVTWP